MLVHQKSHTDTEQTDVVSKSYLTGNDVQAHDMQNKTQTADHVAKWEDKISPQITGEHMRNVPPKVWLYRFQCTHCNACITAIEQKSLARFHQQI